MPRCNLTLKQKSQMIELSKGLTTDQLAKRFHVHKTTVTRTLKKQARILSQVARVNPNFKTVQTNFMSEQHDALVLAYIQDRQEAGEPITMLEVCDKAVACAKELGRHIKSTKAWWRRFKVRCNITKSRVVRNSLAVKTSTNSLSQEKQSSQETTPTKQRGRRKDLKKSVKSNSGKKANVAPATEPVMMGAHDTQAKNVTELQTLKEAPPPSELELESPASQLTQLNNLPVNNFETVVSASQNFSSY